jgi:hypothetical protein
VLDPLNIEEIFELIQVPGFESAVRDQKEKTLSDIQQLLNEQPIQGQPGPDGSPAPPQPSIPSDPFDNHAVVAGIVAKWMISKTGQQAKNQQPAGFANVQAFQSAHETLAAPPLAPPPPRLKSAVSWTGKLEDFPKLIPEILQASGLPAPCEQPPAPALRPELGDMGVPAPVGPATPAAVQQASPIPALPAGGPPALPVQ